MKAKVLLAGILGLAVWVGAGLRRVGPDELAVRDGLALLGGPKRAEPGLRAILPGLQRLVRYPAGESVADFTADGVSWVTKEGSRLAFRAKIRYRVDPSRLLEMHRAAAGAPLDGALLRPALVEALEAVSRDPGSPGVGTAAFREEVRGKLAGSAGARGLTLVALEEVSDLPGGGVAREPAPRGDRNVLLVGLDGADWDVAEPLMARGEMPNLARLVRDGVRARLRSIAPMLSPVIWTSVATGKGPAKHGIVDFLAVAPSGRRAPVTSTLRKTEALWNLLGDSGVGVAITGWWATWPAEPVRGFLVTDRVAYQLFRDVVADTTADARGKSWPATLIDDLRSMIVAPGAVTDREIAGFVDLRALGPVDADAKERLDSLKTVVASTRTYEAIALELLRRSPNGFHAVYNESTDTVAHLFMAFRPPARGVDRARAAAYGGAVDEAYRRADAMLGRLLAATGASWNVIVLSDHGFRHAENRPTTDPRVGHGPAADWHDRFGVLVLHGPDIRRGVTVADASVLDVTPTILALYGMPVGEDMDGRVLDEAIEPSFLASHPVRRVPTYERGTRQASVVEPTAADDELVAKLQALGYVGGRPSPPDGGAAPEGGAEVFALDSPSAIVNRGIVLLTQHDVEGAIREFEAAKRAGGGLQAVANLAYAHLLSGRLDEAAADLEEIERLQPASPFLPALRGTLADLRGDTSEAERLLREAIRIDPADARARTRLGFLLERTGRRDEAASQYREAIRVDPNGAEALNYSGNIERERGNLDAAERFYRRAIDVDPRYPGAYNNLGLLLQQRGRLDEAVALYRKGLGQAPSSPLLRNSLGTLLILKRDLDGAEAEIREALELAPTMAEASNNLGILLAERGRVDEARAAFEAAIDADPKQADARFNLGKVLLLKGDAPGALAAFAAAHERAPGHRDAAIGAGEVAFRLGRRDEALRWFEKARAIDPDVPRLRLRLGELYLERGDRRRAAEEWRRSLALDPSQKDLASRLRALEGAGAGK